MPHTITIAATIAADPQTVWNCWTKPEHITKWNFASDDWCCPHASNDLRTGGKYQARMEAKDGSFGFDFEAIYDLIHPCQHISYTIADGRHVATSFTHVNGNTEVITRFDAEPFNPIEMQQQGWQAILNNFKKYVESLPQNEL